MFLLNLRNQTKLYHDSLEYHSLNQKLFSPNFIIEDYINFIDLQYCIWKSVEEKIAPHKLLLQEKYNIDFVSRASEAFEELKYLNKIPSILEFKIPIDDSFESCLALLYILEGSRHGAMVILKKVKEHMPENHQFYFLNTDINSFVQKWNFIVRAIESSNEDSSLQEKFINTVNLLYTSIQRFYDEYSAISTN
jgi:heme oxygenase